MTSRPERRSRSTSTASAPRAKAGQARSSEWISGLPYGPEHSGESWLSLLPIPGEVDRRGTSNDVIPGDKSPEAAVVRTVSIVTHHEKVVLLDGIAVRDLSIDPDNAARVELQIMPLISRYDILIHGQIFQREPKQISARGYIDRSIVVAIE